MSGIAGCCQFDGSAPSPETHAILTRAIAECGSDATWHHEQGPAVLVQRSFHTGRAPEPQQHYERDGLVVVWDGRIDNRDALARSAGPFRSDAECIANLYRANRDGAFAAEVVGDFAFALWDAQRRTLILGRDAFGIRTLFYHASPRKVVFATRIEALLEPDLGLGTTIDDDYLGGYLTDGAGGHETPYREIRVAHPGALLVFTPEGSSTRKLWSMDDVRDIVLGSDREYEERLLELLRESVAVRMQTDRPVASELSGGLDSSTIVCLADRLLSERAVPAPGLVTISYVFDEAPISDERKFIVEVENAIGRRGFHLREEDHRILSTIGETESPLYPTPEICFVARHRHVQQTMEVAGARVLMRGIGGDQVLWGEADQLYEPLDHWMAGRYLSVHRSLRAWAPALRTSYFALLRRSVLRPVLGKSGGLADHDHRMPEWLSHDFAERSHLHEREHAHGHQPGQHHDHGHGHDHHHHGRAHHHDHPPARRLPSWRAQKRMIADTLHQFSLGYYLDRGSIDVTYPFMHRPLVEFCLGMPLGQKLRPGETRSVLRRALRDVLPPAVAKRKSKSGPDEAIVRALAREWPVLHEMFSSSRAAAHGIIDQETFLVALKRARHGVNINTPALLRIISIECWLRTLERRKLRSAA